jgi:hypothetical protein
MDMTQFIDPSRLQWLSVFRAQPASPVDRIVPVVRWSIDQATGRPVTNWELAPRHQPSSVQARL